MHSVYRPVFALLAAVSLSLAATGAVAHEAGRSVPYIESIASLIDKDAKTAAEIADQPDAFTVFNGGTLHLGFARTPVWVRVDVHNPGATATQQVLSLDTTYADDVDFFSAAGRKLTPSPLLRTMYRPLLVDLPAEQTSRFYIRISDASVMVLPISLSDPSSYEKKTLLEQALFVSFFGIAIAVAVYLLTGFSLSRDLSAPYFVAFLLSNAGHVAVTSGIIRSWLSLDLAGLESLHYTTQGLLIATSMMFTRSYLLTRRDAPLFDRVLLVIAVAGLASIFSPYLPRAIAVPLVGIAAGPGILIALIGSCLMAIRGSSCALTYIGGWSLTNAVGLYIYLRVFDLVPHHWFLAYALTLSGIFGAFYFATALALRLRAQHRRMLQLERMDQSRIDYVAGMSHELRTPLNAIIGFADVIKSETLGPVQPTAYRDYVDHIRDASGHLLSIVNRILDLAKIESGHFEIEREPAAIREVIDEATDMLQPLARTAQIDLVVPAEEHEIIAHIDRQALLQVLINLLSNAIKYTPEGGQVSVGVNQDAATLMLYVEDTGLGISDQELERVLIPFEQASQERSKARAGTGLGLPISKRLIELHGGTFTIASKLERGTRIDISVPNAIIDSPSLTMIDGGHSADTKDSAKPEYQAIWRNMKGKRLASN